MSASAVRGGQVFVEIGGDARKLFATINKLGKNIGKVGSDIASVGTKMTGFGVAMAAPIALATRQFASFDDAIRMVAAVSGSSGAELQALNDTARRLGATTSFTAVEVANLMTELGRAGFDAGQIQAMTAAVLDLARATGTDATLASGIMAATLRQFGLGAEEATRAADVLTMTANATFNSVESLGESLKYAGPVAKSLGMSLEDTAAILGILGNVGIQGSEAGTALRRLSVISAGAGDDLQRIFGITNVDAGGGLKPLVQILDEIAQVTANMPVAERTAKMAEAFGLLGITSANVLSQTAGGVTELAERLQHAEGTAAKAAKEMDAGLGGSFRIALSAIEGTALAIGDALGPSLQSMVDFVGQAATALTRFVKENEALVISVAKGIAIFTAAGLALVGIGTALSVIGGAIAFITSPLGIIVAGVVGLGAALELTTGLFSGMAGIATTTFNGIYEAIVAGDLTGAMDILWAGLYAGWLSGTEKIMGAVDSWVAFFQNTFTYMVANIQNTWDSMISGIAQVLTTGTAVILGVVDNIVNGVMASFDAMVAAVRKSWNYVQSFIVRGYDLAKENSKVDNEMDARRRARESSRPGIRGRIAQAAETNSDIARGTQQQIDARNAAADATAAGRLGRNDELAAQRAAATQAAEDNLAGMTRGAALRRGLRGQADSTISSIENATSMAQLQEAADEFHALAATGQLAADQIERFEQAADAASERLTDTATVGGGAGGGTTDPEAMRRAAEAAAASQAQVAGTFSAAAVGQMGFGSNLAQQQLDEQKKTNQILEEKLENGAVGD